MRIEPEQHDLVSHVVFDPDSGRILGTLRHDAHEHAEPAEQGGCHCGEDPGLLDAFLPEGDVEHATPRLAALPADAPTSLAGLRVDVSTGALRPLPHLVVDLERSVLEGDGQDTVTVEIRAVDADGSVVEDFTGDLHVQAARGKLSERGGDVRMERGRATIRLTSVPETVDRVPLVVTAVDAQATPARTAVTFA